MTKKITLPDLAPTLETSAPRAAAPDKPNDHSANRYGVFLIEEARAGRTLDLLYSMAVGAFSLCDTLEQFRSVRSNLRLAEEIRANREAAR